ncbi:MAG: ATP-dependent Clp protease proteolytic subunit [Candidatus Kapaibacterium sp.]
MKNHFNEAIREKLNQQLREIEVHFDADLIFFYGEIHPIFVKWFRDFIEDIKNHDEFDRNRLVIMLNTPGGSVETVEKMVEIIRFHYEEVFFIVPDYAMSAGTIFCMSGDKIYMDYSSSLGPIDPQVFNGKNWVPALGYLDKVEELIQKSSDNNLTDIELIMLQKLDLAELRQYEMARNLTVELLKVWLVKYKFKDWHTHSSTKKKVTEQEKKKRAEETARLLSNNKLWHSHGRYIGINTVRDVLKIRIEDYSNDKPKQTLIREYNDLICQYIREKNIPFLIHSRIYF